MNAVMKTEELQTIRGYVQALPKTPGHDDAARVALVTEDGVEYHILHKNAGMDLVDFISADVEVQGVVSELADVKNAADGADEDAGLLLTVRSYRLTDGYDDPWYDDET
jgi:NMD protein affecting ribosome stability and mRNA decay